MATEIERKFLVIADSWRDDVEKEINIVQGYLANTERGSVRIRLSGDKANLNIKSMTLGVSRSEFDYPIPVDEAQTMLDNLCMRPLIEKVRHLVRYGEHLWEIDEFSGENKGLIVAEIELKAVDEQFNPPPWLGKEVSNEVKYYNVCLIENPYSKWGLG